MNKYNIKVGDYVETLDGRVGYVKAIGSDFFLWVVSPIKSFYSLRDANLEDLIKFDDIKKKFKRIGVNDFTKKKKFEPINRYNQNGNITYFDKINELIDHINAIQERLNEYDNSRTN